jgi:hypothetical protein
MVNNYKIGQMVEVSFVGKITEISLVGDKVCYAIDATDCFNSSMVNNYAYARRITEDCLLSWTDNDYQPCHPDDK